MKIEFGEDGVQVETANLTEKERDRQKKKYHAYVASIIQGCCMGLFIVAYLILGFVIPETAQGNGWTLYWPLVFVAFVPSGIYHAIAAKNPNLVPAWAIACAVYFFIAVFTGQYHPYWLILLAIPVYYSLANGIRKAIDAKKRLDGNTIDVSQK